MPGDSEESLFIATQVGKIFYISKGSINTFLDIRSQIIELGTSKELIKKTNAKNFEDAFIKIVEGAN